MMKRLLLNFCLLCTLVTGIHPVWAQYDEKIQVPGLRDSVKINRDRWGVNHIYANNQYDLFFAQGYSAAKDRLFQFELWRRQATGTVSEILGPSELKRDIGLRLFKYRGNLEEELSHYHPDGVQIINAYVDGINAYIDAVNQTPESLPIEFKILNIKPGKWTPEVVISRHQGLLGNIGEELDIGRADAEAGEEIVKDLMWFHPKQPNLQLDPSITKEMLSHNILELYRASHRPISFGKAQSATIEEARKSREESEGSNNWVVSGKHTDSGFPYLANDPHRSITLPSLRYIVHLSAPGWNVIGGGEPVIPGVSIGHNAYGAWGLTIFETDFEDLYVYDLNPRNLNQYKYKDKWVDMKTIQETIPIKGQAFQEVDLRYTRHGPVVYIDSIHHKGYAVRCAWLEPGGAPYLASLRFNQAKNWAEFREATTYSHVPAENMIWADKHGDIGWQVVGIAPIRRNFSGMVPVPGDGRFEWDGYLPMQERPNDFNPEKGYLATANQNVTPPDYKHWETVGYQWADPFRGDRINEVLGDKNTLSMQDHKDLQMDYFSIPARELVPMLKEIEFSDPTTIDALDRMRNWDYRMEANSISAGIYAMWERKLYEEANRTFVPGHLKGLISIQLSKLLIWLNNADPSAFNPIADKNLFLRKTFENAVAGLEKKLGNDPAKWTYGQVNYKHTSFNHPLHYFLSDSQRKNMDLGPLPRGGNSHTPNVSGSGDRQSHGASFRVIMDVGDWDKTLMTNVPGQSGDPSSKFYKNLYKDWAENQYFPAYFSDEKIKQNTSERILLIAP